MKRGDTIQCDGLVDMWQTKRELERKGIYADPEFPISDFKLTVWKVKEGGNDRDKKLTNESR